MKIMIVTPYFYPKIGGLESYALNIAKGLKKQGNDVFVVTSNHKQKKRIEEKVLGLRVIRLPILFKFSNTPINPLWYFQLKKIIRDEKPDIINAHSPVPFMADMAVRAAKSTPTALTYHAAKLEKDGSIVFNVVAKMYSAFQKPTLRRATSIIAVSDYVKECLPNKYQEKTSIIYNAIEPLDIPKDKVKRIRNRLIFIGSLDRSHAWKGLDEIIHSVEIVKRSIPNVELLVVGDGDMKAVYEATVKKLNLQTSVKFQGPVVGDKKYKLVQSSSVLVLYPTSANDAFPTVLLEAWACSTLVVAAKIGAIGSILKDQDLGLLVRPNDPNSLANGIIKLLRKNIDIDKLSENALDSIYNNFNWHNSSKVTNSLFMKLIRPNVCFINNIIPPYRLPFFEEINKKFNLTVVFCGAITKDRVWSYDLKMYNFRYIVLKGFKLGPVFLNTNALTVLRRLRFDVVVVNSDPDIGPVAVLAFLIAKLRVKGILIWSVVTEDKVHYFPSIAYSTEVSKVILLKIISKIVIIYRKFCFSMADNFLVLSKQSEKFLERHGIDKKSITRTTQIMPLSLLPDPSIKISRNGKTFLYIGYLNERKGISHLLDAFVQLHDPELKLIVAGTGPLEDKLKAQAKIDPRISFRGYVESVDRANLYAQADIFVLPTLQDVWALVVNEAIHYGLAIICSDAATSKELIDAKTGRVFKAADTSNLLKVMSNLIEDQSKLKYIQANNLQNTKVTDLVKSVKGFNLAIQRALKDKNLKFVRTNS